MQLINYKMIFKKKLKAITKKQLVIFASIIVIFVGLTISLLKYQRYLNNEHKNNEIIATIGLPYEFYYDYEKPSVYIKFNKPIIKTENIEKNFNDSIKISPEIRGDFVFSSPTYLTFTPKENWKPDTEYEISFKKNIESFNNLTKSKYNFKTTPNVPFIGDFELYENPTNIKDKKIVATLNFIYPVEKNDVEKKISLELNNNEIKFSLKFDNTKIYLESEAIQIKEEEDYAVLTYKTKDEDIKDRIRIPSSSDYFRFESVSTTTAFNDNKQEEEQFVVLYFTRPVEISKVLNTLKLQLSEGECRVGNVDKLLKKAKPLNFESSVTNNKFSKIISVKIDVKNYKNMCILTSLDGQLKSQDDFILNDNEKRVNNVPSFVKEAKIIFDGLIVDSNRDKKLTFVSRGYNGLRIEIDRLNENTINHLVTQTNGDFKSASFNNPYYFNESNIAEKFYEIITLDDSNPAKSTYSSIDLEKYIKYRKGIFIIKVSGYDSIKKKVLSQTDRRMVMVTDIGIVVKSSNNNIIQDIFVSSIDKGLPSSHVKVDLVAINGTALSTKYTDENGHVDFSISDKYKDEKRPIAFILYNSDDVSFIPFSKNDRNLEYSRFDVGGIYESTSSLKYLIFTDRDLYRPGETANIGFVLKNSNLSNLPVDMPLIVSIRDVSGNEVFLQKVKNDNGFFDLEFKTKSTMPTGDYTIYLYNVNTNTNNRGSYIGSKTIRLEEFQPDRMKIKLDFENITQDDGWYDEKKLNGEIKLENLFGAPAQNRVLKATLNVRPAEFYFSKFKGYKFTDLWKDNSFRTQEIKEELSLDNTDNNGVTKFNIDLSNYEFGTYNLSLTVEGFEADGGRGVIMTKNILISPLNSIIGYKTNSDLSYINKNSKHSIEFIGLNKKLDKVDINNLKIKIKQIVNEDVLTEDASGRLVYQKEEVYNDISTNDFSISKDGTIYNFPTDIVGDMQISVVDEKENELAIINYEVIGESDNTFSVDKNGELKLILNKNEYNSDEIIEMSITTQYTGYGLITIEKDKIYSYKWFKTNGTNTVQTIKLPANVDSNAYINVIFARDLKSKEIFINPISYAVAPFSINKSKFNNKINLVLPEKVKPNDILTINYELEKTSDIIIYGVDEGILSVAKYQTPNPLNDFIKKIALQVKTSQILDLVLPNFDIIKEVAGIGGDMYNEEYDKSLTTLNPFARKVNKPVVFWSGILRNQNKGTYSYKIPDYFNGKMRIMAVAIGNETFGSASVYVNSQADIVLTPNVPTNISPNDEIEVSVGVGNYIKNSGKNAQIEIIANASDNLKIIGSNISKLNIDENNESIVKFTVKALDKLGNAEIKFTAKSGDFESSIVSTMSVRPSSAYQVLIESGMNKNKTIKNIKGFYDEYNENKLVVSTSPLVMTQSLFDFLAEYPYGCTEQIVSKIFPAMVLKSKYPELIKYKNFDVLFGNTISELSQRQNNSGSFSAWSSYGSESNSFYSIYTMHFLTIAKQNNYLVPNEMFDRGIRWLKDYITTNPDDIDDLRNEVYGIYVLTLNDILPTANLVSLEKLMESDYKDVYENDITSVYMASIYKLMQDDAKANSLIKKFKLQNDNKYYNSFDSNDIRTAQYIYLTGLYFPNTFSKIKNDGAKYLLDIIQNNRYNSLLSSYSILALSSFTNDIKDNSINFVVKDKTGKELEINYIDSHFTMIAIPNNVGEVSFKSNENLYYNFIQKGFLKDLQKAYYKNIDISKNITDLDGNKIDSAKQGDEILVNIRIQNLTKNFMENLAVVDLLPSGFEIKEVIDNGNLFQKDVREDRLIGYLNLSSNMVTITYRVKLTTKGKVIVPATYIQDLYNTQNQALSDESKFVVE